MDMEKLKRDNEVTEKRIRLLQYRNELLNVKPNEAEKVNDIITRLCREFNIKLTDKEKSKKRVLKDIKKLKGGGIYGSD